MAGPPTGAFKIIWSEHNRWRVRELGERAIEVGQKKPFLESMETVLQKLSTEPLDWGDPYYRLKVSGMILCHGSAPPIHVYYAVDEENKLVFVKEVLAMPGQGLDD